MQSPPHERELFESLLANPDDPTPRMLLSDALLERGERFGEVLLLNAMGSAGARERKLSERWAESYYASLLAACSDWSLRDGLLDAATLRKRPRTGDLPESTNAEDVRWGTLRTLECQGDIEHTAAFMRAARLPWLRDLKLAGGRTLTVFLESDHRPTSLAVAHANRDQLEQLADSGCHPQLEHLWVRRVESLEAFRESGVHGRAWVSLGVAARPSQWEPWLHVLCSGQARQLLFLTDTWRFRLDPQSMDWTLEPLHKWSTKEEALRCVRNLPRRWRNTLQVRGSS